MKCILEKREISNATYQKAGNIFVRVYTYIYLTLLWQYFNGILEHMNFQFDTVYTPAFYHVEILTDHDFNKKIGLIDWSAVHFKIQNAYQDGPLTVERKP